MSINFVTFDMLNNLLIKNLPQIPHDVDVVVGVPRSGLLLANMIACYLNKPLADVESVLAGKWFESGRTKNKTGWVRNFSTVKKILVVDDSVDTGKSINQAKERLAGINVEKIYLTAFVTRHSVNMVDLYFAVLSQPRMFEWNYIHHGLLKKCCVDFDGILCEDPTKEQNDDGENYRNFILNATPKFIPSRPIGWIVTSRLKKYEEETLSWLRKYNIQFNSLIMLDMESAAERRAKKAHASFKAQIYGSLEEAALFIESEPHQAQEIAQLSKKNVFCPTNSIMHIGGANDKN